MPLRLAVPLFALLFLCPVVLAQAATKVSSDCPKAYAGSDADAPTLDPPVVGLDKISGKVPKLTTGNVLICVNGKVAAQAAIYNDGTFAAKLSATLSANDQVQAQTAPTDSSKPGVASSIVTAAAAATNHYNLGPVRTYLSIGAILSQDNNQFQGSAIFLDLDVDNMWYRHRTDSRAHHGWARWLCLRCSQANTYFDARLTTAPVTSCAQATPTAAARNCVSSSSTPIETFNSSKKSALVSGGLYLPIYFSYFPDPNDSQHGYRLFFAPLAKGGIQTLVESAQSTTGVPGGTQTNITTLGNQTFFHYGAAGGRLGLFRMHNETNQDIPPETIIYLDITGGRYENFATVDPKTGAVHHPWRIGLEGRFRIPGVKFLMLGFDSNTRTGSNQGDLRFLFGTTFDVGCVVNKLLGSSTADMPGCDSSSKSGGQKAAR